MTPRRLQEIKELDFQIKSAEAILRWLNYVTNIENGLRVPQGTDMKTLLQDNAIDEFMLANCVRGGQSWLQHKLEQDLLSFKEM